MKATPTNKIEIYHTQKKMYDQKVLYALTQNKWSFVLKKKLKKEILKLKPNPSIDITSSENIL